MKTQKHPGGRPTKYKRSYPKELLNYFMTESRNMRLPFLSAWARNQAGVCEDTAIEWTKRYPEFSESYKKAKDIQKEVLIVGGLTGKFQQVFAIFTAKNITDMRDKQEVDTTKTFEVTGLEKLNDEDLDGLIKGLQNRVGKSAPGEAAQN